MVFSPKCEEDGNTYINHVGMTKVNDDYVFVMECMSDEKSNEFKFWTMLDETSPEREQEIMDMYNGA